MDIAQVVVGLSVLTIGADVFVAGASAVGRLLGVRPAVIGLTIVAAGTSMPEFVVTLQGATSGRTEIAVGNVLGSNIFNATLILGLAALISPLRVLGPSVRLEWPVMFASTLAVMAMIWDGRLVAWEGAVLFAALIAFVHHLVRTQTSVAPELPMAGPPPAPMGKVGATVRVAAGLLSLVFGSEWFIGGATGIAQAFSLSDRVIGLTIVAAGTSLPELATSAVASYRGEDDIAVTNVLGSNIFNLLWILGITAMVAPLPVSEAMRTQDCLWALGTAAVLAPLMWTGMRISRVEGAVLVGLFFAYLAWLVG